MKLFAYILTFHILFLALEPGLKVIFFVEVKTECCGGSCKPNAEEKSKPEQQPVKKGCDNQAGCNPFEICNACSGYLVVLTSFSRSPYFYHIEPHTTVIEKFPSKIAHDFWQPPKIG